MLSMVSCEHGRSNYLKSCRPPRGPDQPQQPLSSLPTAAAVSLPAAPFKSTLISVQGPTQWLPSLPRPKPHATSPLRTDDTVSLSRPVTSGRHRRLKNGFSLAGRSYRRSGEDGGGHFDGLRSARLLSRWHPHHHHHRPTLPPPRPSPSSPAQITAAYRLCGCHQRVTRIRRRLNSLLFFLLPRCVASLDVLLTLQQLARKEPKIHQSLVFCFFLSHRPLGFNGS